MKITRCLALTLFCIFHFLLPAHADDFSSKIIWETLEQIDLEKPPLDVAASLDGKWLYILEPGHVLLYSLAEHAIVERVPVEETYNCVAVSRKGTYLIVSSLSMEKVELIKLTTVYHFSGNELPRTGPDDAKISITVFNDYQCSYCRNLESLLEQIRQKYPQDVSIIYKDFPLPMHKSARMAAAAALAANRQQKYPEFHKKLLENQQALNEAKIHELAGEVGLDLDKFQSDLADPAIQQLISRDIREGQLADVRATPTVFVNGKLQEDRSFPGFVASIEAELKTDQAK